MKTESEFPDAYADFMRDCGIPHTLRRDNAKSQQNPAVLQSHCQNSVMVEWTEPLSPWQIPAELNGVKYLKTHAQVLLDQCGAPSSLWFLAQQYLVDVYMVTSHPQLKWQTPLQVSRGIHWIFHTS